VGSGVLGGVLRKVEPRGGGRIVSQPELHIAVQLSGEKRRANGEQRKANSELAALQYHVHVQPTTAFILAGGRSSRMGSDKALLSFGGKTLLERALQTVGTVVTKTYIVGPQDRYAPFGNVIEDIYAGCGPLAGIHVGLGASTTDLNLMLSVDMPLMSARFLAWLLGYAREAREMIVVPVALGGPQPLCAVYRRGVLPWAESALATGRYKIGHLFSLVPTCRVSEPTIVAAGFSPEIFRNINTSAEYDELLNRDTVVTRGEG